ncbi:MAG: M20 family metallopeptidase [Chloroflexi bacterium]|nr:M20 family metallopeptidase [Chloroflexota bacterium]
MADLVYAEMQALGYHDLWRDEIGNVVGRVRGGGGLSTCLTAHMDIVDPGDVSRWQHSPFDGEISEGRLWGRGASDTKGALAAQVYAGGLMCQAGLQPAGDVYVAAAVGEEISGFGMQHMLTWLHPDLAVVGEPSGNALRRGHRGRFDLVITWRGRSGHASAPERAINPYYSMARFLLALRDEPMATHPDFGSSTAAPTLSRIDQTCSNVIPSELVMHLDWRNVPGESLEDAQTRIERLLAATCDPGVVATAGPAKHPVLSYTGLSRTPVGAFASFVTAPDDPRLLLAQDELARALGRPVDVGVWKFTTDGGHLATAGVWCLGFGPGEEWLAHVVDEYVTVEQLDEAMAGYLALGMTLGQPGYAERGAAQA